MFVFLLPWDCRPLDSWVPSSSFLTFRSVSHSLFASEALPLFPYPGIISKSNEFGFCTRTSCTCNFRLFPVFSLLWSLCKPSCRSRRLALSTGMRKKHKEQNNMSYASNPGFHTLNIKWGCWWVLGISVPFSGLSQTPPPASEHHMASVVSLIAFWATLLYLDILLFIFSYLKLNQNLRLYFLPKFDLLPKFMSCQCYQNLLLFILWSCAPFYLNMSPVSLPAS